MYFPLYILQALAKSIPENHEFISLYSVSQGLKLPVQVKEMDKLYAEMFPNGAIPNDPQPLAKYRNCEVFNLRDADNNFVSSVIIKNTKYFETNNSDSCTEHLRTFQVLEIYSLAFVKKYQKSGLCREFLKKAIFSTCLEYNLGKDFWISLHISPLDEKMALAFAIYCKYGFNKGIGVMSGPYDLKFDFRRITECESPVIAALAILNNHSEIPKYFAMYIEGSQFLVRKSCFEMRSLIRLGEMLQKKLLQSHVGPIKQDV